MKKIFSVFFIITTVCILTACGWEITINTSPTEPESQNYTDYTANYVENSTTAVSPTYRGHRGPPGEPMEWLYFQTPSRVAFYNLRFDVAEDWFVNGCERCERLVLIDVDIADYIYAIFIEKPLPRISTDRTRDLSWSEIQNLPEITFFRENYLNIDCIRLIIMWDDTNADDLEIGHSLTFIFDLDYTVLFTTYTLTFEGSPGAISLSYLIFTDTYFLMAHVLSFGGPTDYSADILIDLIRTIEFAD